VIAAAGAERALLVGPSMGGGFALELVKTSPERVAGLVAIAPAASESFQLSSGSMPPALILWGEKDEVLPVARARELADHMPGARVEILPAASHACYLDAPGRFHELLVSFTREVFARGSRGRRNQSVHSKPCPPWSPASARAPSSMGTSTAGCARPWRRTSAPAT
jgi:pimeloyl-ACP methyl ester carboxylesterase